MDVAPEKGADRPPQCEGAKVGKEARPLLWYEDDQDQQAQGMLLEKTGDGVSVENEEERLAEAFGPANEDGIYGAPVVTGEEPETAGDSEGSGY